MPIYKNNGVTYNIPEDKAAGFEAKFPGAMVALENEGVKYELPVSKKKGFLEKFPGATYSVAAPPAPKTMPVDETYKVAMDRALEVERDAVVKEFGKQDNANYTPAWKDAVHRLEQSEDPVDNKAAEMIKESHATRYAGRDPILGAIEDAYDWAKDAAGEVIGTVTYPVYKVLEGAGDLIGNDWLNDFGQQGAARATALVEDGGEALDKEWVDLRNNVDDSWVDLRNNILYKNGKDGDLTLIGTLFQATEELVAGVTDPVYEGIEWVGDKAGWDVVEEIGTTGRTNVDKIYENSQYKDNSFLGQVVQLIPQIAGTATSLATGNPIPAKIGLITMVGSSMGSAAREAEKEGASPLEQLGAAFFNGAIELGTERLSLGHWLGKMASKIGTKTLKEAGEEVVEKEAEALFKEAKKELGGKITAKTVKEFAKDLAVEGGSEATAEFLQTFVPIIYRDKDKWPTWHEAFQNAWDGAVGGFLMTGMLHSVGTQAQRKTNDKRWSEQGYIDAAMVTLKDKKGKDNLVVAEVVGEDENGNISILSDNKLLEVNKEDIKTRQQFSYADFKNNVMSIYRSEGYAAAAEQKGAVKQVYDMERERALSVLGEEVVQRLDDDPIGTLAAMNAIDRQEATAYVNAKAAYEGMIDRISDDIDERTKASDKEIESHANKADGMIHPAMMRGVNGAAPKRVYIVNGNVATFEDGTIDKANSSSMIIVRDADTGEVSAASADDLENLEAVIDTEAEKRTVAEQIANEYAGQQAVIIETESVNGEGENEVQPVVAPVVEGQKGEKVVTGDNVPAQATAVEQPVANEVPVSAPVEQLPKEKQTPAPIPTERRGKTERAAYHLVPIERTMEDLHDGALEADEIESLIDARIKEAENDVKATENKKPVIGADKDAYVAAKKQWQEAMDAAKAKLDYYNNLKTVNAEVTRSEMREAVEGVAPQTLIEQTADEFVANQLGGWIKITPESFQKETGLKAEQKQMVGVIAGKDKGGMTIEQAAETILENYGDELRGLGFNGDMQDMRDMIIDILSKGNPRSYAKKGAEMRAQESVEQQMSQLESIAIGMGFKDTDEMIAYEEAVAPRIIQDYTGFDEQEYFNNLAENYEYDTTRESEGTRRGSELLQGEQSADNAGTGNITEPGQGGKVQGDVYSGGENAATQGNQQQVSSPEIPNNQNRDNVSQVEGVAEGEPVGQSGVAASEGNSLVNAVLEKAAEKQKKNLNDRIREAVTKGRIKQWEKRTGISVRVVESIDEVTNRQARAALEAGQIVKGWIDGNEVVIYLPNIESVEDVDKTYIHEVVAHKGLKILMGKDFDKLCDKVWEMMSEEQRGEYLAYIGANLENPTQADMRDAADEYMAYLAESVELTETEKGIWQKIVDTIREFLLGEGVKLTDKDIENLIRASYANLASGNTEGGNGGYKARRVFHGSGAKFDKFDHSFMGTGEGNKVAGWGTYVTNSKNTGMSYAEIAGSKTGERHLYAVEIPDDNGKNYMDLDKEVSSSLKNKAKTKVREYLFNSEDSEYWKRNEKIIEQEWKYVERKEATGYDLRAIMEELIGDAKEVSDIFSSLGFVGFKTDTDSSQGTTYVIFNENDAQIESRTMFRIAKTPQEFDATQKEAVEKRGIVAPNLNSAVVNVVDVPKHDFTGGLKEARAQAEDWAVKNYTGREFDFPDNSGKYVISKKAIGKYLDKTAVEKSDNAAVHLSALKKLPEIISNSIEVELHADYKKDGEGRSGNEIDRDDLLIHRLYGAINIGGNAYRVKTTIREFKDVNTPNSPHSYEVTKIELIEDSTVTPDGIDSPLNRPINSISATKLLNGVEKSYDKGKKILEESENSSAEPVENIRFRKAEVPNLVGVHSTTADKLRKAIKQGGLANPGAAIMTVNSRIPKFGEISFVLPSSMVDKVSGRNAGTYTGDAWTPTYPMTFEKISREGMKRLEAETKDMPLEKQNAVIFAIEEWIEHDSRHWLPYAFLQLRGIDVQAPDKATRMIERVCRAAEFRPWDRLGDREKSKVVELYKEAEFGGDEDAYKKHLEAVIAKLEELKENNDGVFKSVYEREITAIEKNGFFADEVEEFLDGALADFQVNADALSAAENVIRENGLVEKYEDWKNGLKDLYAGSYFHADGRDIENTLENVSDYMASRKPAGSEEFVDNFKKFAASHMDNMASLDDIRKHKNLLSETNEGKVDFITDWENRVYKPLVEKLDRVYASGRERIQELSMQEDPKEYAKKEYGIELTDEDVKGLQDMLQAIKTEYPTPYFETKFNRPVYFNEFAGVALPENVGEDIVEALNNAGLKIETYEPGNEKARVEAIKRLSEGEGIRFRKVNENQEIFVSNARKAVEEIKQEKATPQQWLAMIKKNGGLKAGEEAWLGLEEWLNEKQAAVTKQEILDFIGENKIQIEEVEYESNPQSFEDLKEEYEAMLRDEGYDAAHDAMVDRFGDDFDIAFEDLGGELAIANEEAAATLLGSGNIINSTRLDYTTEGLENKREIALTVPTIEPYNQNDDIHFGDAGNGRAVAWVRFGETTDSEGNRVLVIDEIQSKRHQDGREKGYKNPNAEAELEKVEDAYREAIKAEKAYNAELKEKYGYDSFEGSLFQRVEQFVNSLTEEEKAKRNELKREKEELAAAYENLLKSVNDKGVPAAPFEKNWQELAMKRMLRLAAEEGFDKVAWTTGEQQAERYNIGAVVNRIESNETVDYDSTLGVDLVKQVVLFTRDGNAITLRLTPEGIVRASSQYNGHHISDIVGKELGNRIMTETDLVLKEQDLRIGGEGMKGFYDRMLPSFVSKYTKKWGAKVGEVTMPNLRENNTMHSVDVTPEMKESVMEGLTMFRKINKHAEEFNKTHKGGVPVVDIDPNNMEAELAEEGFTTEEIKELKERVKKGVAAVYNTDKKIIYLLVPSQDKESVYSTCWHEDTHAAIDFLGLTPEMMDEFYSFARGKKKEDFENLLRKHGYEEEDFPEESLAYAVQAMAMLDNWSAELLSKLYGSTVEGAQRQMEIIQPLIDYINNGRQGTQSSVGETVRDRGMYNNTANQKKTAETEGTGATATGELTESEIALLEASTGYTREEIIDMFGYDLNREGAGPLTDREVVMESDPYSKVLGKPRYYGKRQREFVARQRRRMAEKARQVAEKLNLDNVEVLESTEGLTGKKATSKGWFDPKTGKITVVVPNHGSTTDITETVLHEAVAHYGLRKLFGENFKNFLDNVYRNVTPEIRAEITELAKKHGWDFHTATEEYLASLAENTNFEKVNPSLWSNIKSFFMKMLAKVGITLDESLGDNELRYILWRSYRNMAADGNLNNVFGQAEDIAKQYELGVGNYASGEVKTENGDVAAEDDSALLHREGGAPGSAREEYERKVRRPNKSGSVGATENVARRAQEAYQDSMLALKILQDAVARETGNEVKDNENAYIAENRMSSSNKAMVEIYERDFFMPLMDEINALIKEGVEYDDIIRYLHAKHGLERNEYMRRKQAEEAARRELGEEPAMPNEGDADYEAKVNAKAAWRANLVELTESYVKKFAKRDYSGLTALTETANAKDAEAAAQQMVDEFENDHGTTPLWEAVNKATKETLRREFVGGLIDRATYDTVSTMFDFYIPLRGWDENVAANEYEYFTNNNTPVFTPAIKTMHGRKSLADDPIATIGYMAGSAIARANRNLMKQKFLNFVMNNPTSLATVSEQWYTMDYGTNEWVPNNPAIPEDATPEQVVEIVEAHEANMRALEKAGKATRERSGLKIGLHATKQEQQQHVVRVMRNGKEYAVYINGNPRAAQALNGMTNPDVSKSKAREAAQNVKNFMARAFTSRNPAFIISNSARDIIWAGTAVAAKEDAEYTKQYTKNVASVLATFKLPRLLRKFRNGTLDMNNEIERYFDEFLRNGGETGFTQVLTVEDYKKNIKRFTKEAENGTKMPKKAWRSLWNGIEFLNRSAEDITRFTVYMTSRQMGRSIERSVYDAKEITVNFNKKGSGEMGARYLNFAYIFFNATIQSLANFGKLTARHPGKMAAALGTYSMMGFLMPVINAALMAMMGGDEEDYWNLPEWVRRNNIVLFAPWTEKGFITIPLPHEIRPFYGMGENARSALQGKQSTEDAMKKSLVGFTGMLPIDFTANGGDVVVNVMPTILQPLAQVRANVTHFGTPIYKDNDFNKRYPSWTKAYKGTNSTLVAATKWLNELGGGNNVDSGGLLDWNPAVIEHLFESYLGGMGKTFNKAATTVSMIWDEEARIARNIPVLSSFYQESDERTAGSQLNREYFDALEEMEGFQHRLSGYQKEITKGNAEYEKLFEDLVNSDEFMRYGIIKDYSNAIRELDQILKNYGLTEEKAQEIEGVIQELKNEMLDELEKLQAEE